MDALFSAQDVELLKKHLQAVSEVEFFTIPLYLTAVYSFTQQALNYSPDPKDTSPTYPLYNLQQETLSVAVQEMYHLQEACNLANAFCVTPQMLTMSFPAGQQLIVPHLDPNSQPLTTQLGNLDAVMQALIEVEVPDPNPTPPPPNDKVSYPSIADLYHATLVLLKGYLRTFGMLAISRDPYFVPNHDQVAYTGFASQYKYNAIATRATVAQVANAITDQGEGSLVAAVVGGPFRSAASGGVLPEYQPSPGSRFYAYDGITHYERFVEVQSILKSQGWEQIIGGAVFYEPNGKPSPDLPSWAPDYKTLQASLNTIWSFLVDTMQAGFQDGSLLPNNPNLLLPGFSEAMLSFKYIIPLIWQQGYCPSFMYSPNVTTDAVQQAMDKADPLCLFHWDAATREVRINFPHNSCQGLNQCAGQGWGGIGTQKGDGACATADLHTCGANNSCKFEGGCGFLVSKSGESCGAPAASSPQSPGCNDGNQLLPPSEEWIPGENSCGSQGGCQTPIAPDQVFNRNAAPTIEAQTDPAWTADAKKQVESLIGTKVWDRARKLFAEHEGLGTPPAPIAKQVGGIDYNGTERRKAIAPTSK